MAGFLGLRGVGESLQHETRRERRGDERDIAHVAQEQERRSREKVQEILEEQQHARTDGGPRERDSEVAEWEVRRVMSGSVAVVSFDDILLTVQGIFSNVRFHHLPVVEEDGCIVGLVSDRDFFRIVSPFFGTVNEQTRDKELMLRKVGTIMTRNPICIRVDERVVDAVQLMNMNFISCLPVVDQDDCLQGIMTWKDVVRAVCPSAFNSPRDSTRLRSDVHAGSSTTESARLRSRAVRIAPPEPAPEEPAGYGLAALSPDPLKEAISRRTTAESTKLRSRSEPPEEEDVANKENEKRFRAKTEQILLPPEDQAAYSAATDIFPPV